MTNTTKPKTAAEINARMGEIGAELAKGRIVPVPNARELEAELNRLKLDYVEALDREGEAARDAAEIKARVESARRQKQTEERDDRIRKAVAEAVK